MISKKEAINLIIGVIIFILIIMFSNNKIEGSFLNALIIAAVIVFVSVTSKKITSYKLDMETEIKLLEFRRYWISTGSVFKKPLPLGVIFPLLMSFLSAGIIKWLTFFQFDLKALPSKVAKRFGVKRYSSVMEWDYALVIFYSTISLLILAIICSYLTQYTSITLPLKEISRFSIYYCLWNLIPFGQLDGMKLYMSSRPLYITTLIIIAVTALIVFI